MTATIPPYIISFFDESTIPLALSDSAGADDALILANQPFYHLTGFGPSEVLGQNCRFMHGPGTQKHARQTIRADFTAKRDSRVLIRNYRKDGQQFDNFLYIFTILDRHNKPLYRLGSQFEVPARNRNAAFERHIDRLRKDLDKLNHEMGNAGQQLINTADLEKVSVKELLAARLEALKLL